ncbi:heavy metal translocating P-type ATPase [Bifidobacterium goeldii]|uniref:Heavy metal translocating P-type ATPase n=1 Tax=Bifidobacterium goeldii TaxID=2306975 RepID=A0A430FHJ1_9BIFI|nr:HAD-IC family P-type ATPase [Bifidobacterium goeldii]RSX52232.1 heavy metal translocating P-type ATPase [Bifidobacterium goeldii]
MTTFIVRFFTAVVHICRLVPMLPVVILSAIPLALLGQWHPWELGTSAVYFPVLGNPGVGQWLVIVLVLIIVADTVRGMIDDIRHGQVGIDLLAVVAILSTVGVGEYWASWAVMLMLTSGEAIEEYAQSKAESSLTALLNAAPQTAHVSTLPGVKRGKSVGNTGDGDDDATRGDRAASAASAGRFRKVDKSVDAADSVGGAASNADRTDHADHAANTTNASASSQRFITVPVDQVCPGDVLVVLPGETVPVDGELLSGSAVLDLSAINGEPVPREVYAGARVMSGAVNGASTLTMRATESAQDSQYQRILSLVASAQESRPAVVKTADRLAVPFTVLALVIAAVAWAVSGIPTRFAQVLVLATPCPLLIAAPVAYIAGTGRLAKAGVLIKTQDVLEQLGRVSHVFFDKTGTLTVKQPQVVRVEMLPGAETRLNEDHVLMMAGVVEGYSVHILSRGIAKAGDEAMARLRKRFANGQRQCPEPKLEATRTGHGWEHGQDRGWDYGRDYPVVQDVREDAGKGISGLVNGHTVRVGRLSFANAAADGFQPVIADSQGVARGTDIAQNVNDVSSAIDTSGATIADTAAAEAGIAPRSAVSGRASDDTLRTRFGILQPDEMASYVSVDGRLIARIVLRDVPRENAKPALDRLRALGVTQLTMLTGDKRSSARVIAGEVGIDDVRAELFPEDKVAAVRNEREDHGALVAGSAAGSSTDGSGASRTHGSRDSRRSREITMMVGDGVNDAPVLAVADIGVAMTDGTSTAASESAQVVIMNDDIAAVPQAIAIARRTKRVMLQAVLAGLTLALIGMIAAAFNLIPVVVGAFLQEAIDVISILWALTALLNRD